jgi:hypothetical protein
LLDVCAPNGARREESYNDCGSTGQSEPAWSPSALGGGFLCDADARQERRRNLGVGGDVKTAIDGQKEESFFGEGGAAGGTGSEVRAQFAMWFEARGGGFD